jgi:hypothetical protein
MDDDESDVVAVCDDEERGLKDVAVDGAIEVCVSRIQEAAGAVWHQHVRSHYVTSRSHAQTPKQTLFPRDKAVPLSSPID